MSDAEVVQVMVLAMADTLDSGRPAVEAVLHVLLREWLGLVAQRPFLYLVWYRPAPNEPVRT
jgi:hypothetical protein